MEITVVRLFHFFTVLRFKRGRRKTLHSIIILEEEEEPFQKPSKVFFKMAKRLKTEALDLAQNPLEWGSAEPVGGDLFKWTATVLGPETSPYKNGVFTLAIAVPTEYPFRAPEVTFQTKVYHPNVKTDSGQICADILKEQWKPTLSIRWVLEVVRTMLETPSFDSPLQPEIAAQLKDDPKLFQKTAAEWTKKYAS